MLWLKNGLRRWLEVPEPFTPEMARQFEDGIFGRHIAPLQARVSRLTQPPVEASASQPHDPEPESRTDSWDPHFGNG